MSQNFNCFKTEKIPPVRYKPSKPLLFSSIDEEGIIFKIDESKESRILRKRLISILKVENNKLDSIQQIGVDRAIKKYRILILLNQTDSILGIPHILSRITLIQEAKDKNGNWRPIESSSNYKWCGNTDSGRIYLEPDEFIEIYLRRYCGSFQTKVRTKLLLANGIIYSEEYDGCVNPEIFDSIDFPDNKYFIDISVKEELERAKRLE